MKYPIIPEWLIKKEKDLFNYPLRSAQEIAFDMEIHPPNFPITLHKRHYVEPHVHQEKKTIDSRNEQVIII